MMDEITKLQNELDELREAARTYWNVSDALMIEGDYGPRCARCGAYDGRHDGGCFFVDAEKRLLALLAVEGESVQP